MSAATLKRGRKLLAPAWFAGLAAAVFAPRPYSALGALVFIGLGVVFVRENMRSVASGMERFARGHGLQYAAEGNPELTTRINNSRILNPISAGSVSNVARAGEYVLGHYSANVFNATFCLIELPEGLQNAGVYVSSRADVVRSALPPGTHTVELESTEFSSIYSLDLAGGIDSDTAQRLFAPSTIELLTHAKLPINVTIRNNLVVTYVRGPSARPEVLEALIEVGQRVASAAATVGTASA